MNSVLLSDFHNLIELEFDRKKQKTVNLHDFQIKCIEYLDKEENLLLCSDTGSGKTLVSKFLITKTLSRKEIACYLVPTIELTKEKARELQNFFGDRAKIVILAGEFKPNISEIRKNENKLVI
ncbi:MAG: DEAD/DEAH box helicase, partial [Candidatus Helarchaeota archaeon]